MAYRIPLFEVTLEAGADLSGQQHRFVKLNASGQAVAITAVTDIPVGILQNKPKGVGNPATVMVAGISKVIGAADLSMGNLVGASNDGRAAAYTGGVDTTKYIVGHVLEDNTMANGMCAVLINCMNPSRGA
jgi:hypothetical protein